jgi:hypothetical protein
VGGQRDDPSVKKEGGAGQEAAKDIL